MPKDRRRFSAGADFAAKEDKFLLFSPKNRCLIFCSNLKFWNTWRFQHPKHLLKRMSLNFLMFIHKHLDKSERFMRAIEFDTQIIW